MPVARAVVPEDAYFTRRDPRIVGVAHRGGSHPGVPENSLGALQAAAELGFRYVEIDLHATKDGRLVLWHGAGFDRLRPGRSLDVDELDDEVLREGEGPEEFTVVVNALPEDMCFFLDLKNTEASLLIGKAVEALDLGSRLCVGSFSGARTTTAAKSIEETTGSAPVRTVTPAEFVGLGLDAYLGTRFGPQDRVSAQIPTWAATRRMIQSAHEREAAVIVWTVNDRATMNRLLDRGADGLMSDDLALLRQVLIDRGRWVC